MQVARSRQAKAEEEALTATTTASQLRVKVTAYVWFLCSI